MSETRTVLITGGSRGIGEATVRLFAARGWRVLFTYVRDKASAEKVAGETGGTAYRCDSADPDAITGLFKTLDGDGVYLDALVNNAGVSGPKRRLADVTPDILEDVWRANFMGPVLYCREAAARMSTRQGGRGGVIVNLSSTATRAGGPNQWADYAALKGAIDVLTRGLAREVGEEGVRVNAVAPGYVATDMSFAGGIIQNFDKFKHEVPMGRVGTVEEVAEGIYWLCSDQSTYVTGTVLTVAGGR